MRLAIEARAHLARMAEEAGITFDCEERGILHFYETKADFEAAAKVSALLAKGGLERRAVTPEEMRSIEPALKGTLYGGFYTPSDFTGDIHKFTVGLEEACVRRGMVAKLSTDVLSIQPGEKDVLIRFQSTEPVLDGPPPPPEEARFDKVVICTGVASREIARALGVSRNTVRNHVSTIYGKIGVHRRSGAIVWGRERGIDGQQRAKATGKQAGRGRAKRTPPAGAGRR